jgi:hypothetical protein
MLHSTHDSDAECAVWGVGQMGRVGLPAGINHSALYCPPGQFQIILLGLGFRDCRLGVWGLALLLGLGFRDSRLGVWGLALLLGLGFRDCRLGVWGFGSRAVSFVVGLEIQSHGPLVTHLVL